MIALQRSWDDLTTNAKTALLCAGLGFILSFTDFSAATINGERDCYYYDYAAVALGALAVVFAVFTIREGVQSERSRQRSVLIGAAALSALIGVYHLAGGLGMTANECSAWLNGA